MAKAVLLTCLTFAQAYASPSSTPLVSRDSCVYKGLGRGHPAKTVVISFLVVCEHPCSHEFPNFSQVLEQPCVQNFGPVCAIETLRPPNFDFYL